MAFFPPFCHIFNLLNPRIYSRPQYPLVLIYGSSSLLDIDLPFMNGIAVAEKILKINPDASIVMVTGFRDIDIIRSSMRVGAFDYLVKPVEPAELNRILKKVKERNSLLEIKRNYQERLRMELEKQRKELEESVFRTIISLAKALEAKDPYQKGHSKEVRYIALMIADELGYTSREKKALAYAALIHDIGKVGIPEAILSKPEPLTEEEYSKIKEHPVIGAEILQPSIKDKRIIDAVLYHHERFDGKGFPKGLKGKEISEFARIISLGDALSAMLSKRPYRANFDKEHIIRELTKNSGTQFDPEILEIGLNLFKEGKIKTQLSKLDNYKEIQ
ncbi:MAG: HD domain-containing protein [candidate division WOR-3 bacterium]|nr:HD domain-containing protein [candidate division WOR-3 bacterium]